MHVCVYVCACGRGSHKCCEHFAGIFGVDMCLGFRERTPPTAPLVKCVWLSVPHVAQLNAKTINHASLLCQPRPASGRQKLCHKKFAQLQTEY